MLLSVKVIPKSGRTQLKFEGNMLKVWLTSAPEGGKANEELVRILAKTIGIARSCIEITRGETSRNKTVHISGITQKELTELGRFQLGSKGGNAKGASS